MKFNLKNIKLIFGIALFITIYLIFIFLINGMDVSLNKFSLPSIAAFYNYSITKVVYNFYGLMFGGLLFLILITLLLLFFYDKFQDFRNLSKTLNLLAFLGILIVIFSTAITKNKDIVNFYAIICLLYVVFYFIFMKIKDIDGNIDNNLFYFLIFLTLSAVVGFKDCLFVIKINALPMLCVFCFLFLIISVITRFLLNKIDVSKLFLILLPLFFLPLLSVFKTELFLIFNQHGISLHSPKLLWIIGMIIILISSISIAIYLRYVRKKSSVCDTPLHFQMLYYFIFPIVVISLTSYIFYNPFFTLNNDLFEPANPANSIFKSIEFGEIPFVDYLNSHALSEILFPFCYVFINGYSGFHDFLIYDFIYYVIAIVIIYFFLLKILGKTPLLFFILLLYPFLFFLFPVAFIFALILIILWYNFFNNQNFIKLLLIYFFTIFTLPWRFDLGLPCIFITSIFSILWVFIKFKKEKLFLFFKTIATSIVFFGILVIIFMLRDSENFINNFLQAKSYLTANQEHAYNIFQSKDLKANFIHLILYPSLSILILFYLIYSYKSKKINSKNKLIFISTLFLILFYFFNFQRGLVRHSLAEGTSYYTTSFFYISLVLFILFILPEGLQKLKNHIFIIVVTIPILFTAYPFPDEYEPDIMNRFLTKCEENEENLRYIPLKVCRVSNQSEYEEKHFKEIKEFFNSNFSNDETFIDISQSPMLYFNLKREVPSYFCQYIQNTITTFLQEENLKLIKKKADKIPVVVLADITSWWHDNTDELVPRRMRYNIICKYTYENYIPLTIINKRSIWIRKDLEEKFKNYKKNTDFEYEMKEYHLRKYPYILGKYGTESYKKLQEVALNNTSGYENITVPQNTTLYHNGVVIVRVKKSEKTTNANLIYYYQQIKKGFINFEIQKSDEENIYVLPVSCQYNWYCGIVDTVIFETDIDYDNNISVAFCVKIEN